MKKTLAAIGASALGLTMVGAGAATSATAADTTDPCVSFADQLASTGNVTDNWYQDCVPQYGLGKAEFSIVADEDDPTAEFPAEFIPLDEAPTAGLTVSSSTTDIPALQTYFDSFEDVVGPITATDADLSDPTTQTYIGTVAAPVTSIGAVAPAAVPEGVAEVCETSTVTYGGGWRATFGAVDTTYAQTINGEAWNYTIKATPSPTYFLGDITTDGLGENWCITDGLTWAITSDIVPTDVPLGEYLFALVWPTPIDFENEFIGSLGTFARDVPEQPVVPAELAATGVDGTPLVFAAGAFTAFGLALLGFTGVASRRRRTQG